MECTAISQYWNYIIRHVSAVAQISVVLSSRMCSSGLVEDLFPTVAQRGLLSLLLFYAREATAMSWKKYSPLSIQFWKQLVNSNLPLYHKTYNNMGLPKKFSKVWACWLGDVSMATAHTLWYKHLLLIWSHIGMCFCFSFWALGILLPNKGIQSSLGYNIFRCHCVLCARATHFAFQRNM